MQSDALDLVDISEKLEQIDFFELGIQENQQLVELRAHRRQLFSLQFLENGLALGYRSECFAGRENLAKVGLVAQKFHLQQRLRKLLELLRHEVGNREEFRNGSRRFGEHLQKRGEFVLIQQRCNEADENFLLHVGFRDYLPLLGDRVVNGAELRFAN